MNYALLVGIDTYKSFEISNLKGCVNDVMVFKTYLIRQFEANIDIQTLTNKNANRETIIRYFRSHLGKAGEGDLALFYFSGHGSREPAPEEFWVFQPDHKLETIVPHDSSIDAEDIADKEINVLIRELSDKGVEVVTIFDCCHSGSATRATGIRSTKGRQNPRLRDEFLEGVFTKEDLPPPPHIHFAACLYGELAREKYFELSDKPNGIFTYTLLTILEQTRPLGMITYANLDLYCRLGVDRKSTKVQTPNLEAFGGKDMNKLFLHNNTDSRRPNRYIVSSTKDGIWKVNIGLINGLTVDGKASFAIKCIEGDEEKYKGEAITTSIGLFESTLNPPQGFDPLSDKVLYAEPISLPFNPYPVFLNKNELIPLMDLIQELPDAHQVEPSDSFAPFTRQRVENYFLFTPNLSKALIGLRKVKEHYELFHTETGRPIVPGVTNGRLGRKENFRRIIQGLFQIYHWQYLTNFQNSVYGNVKDLESIKLELEVKNRGQIFDQEFATLDVDTSYSLNINGKPEWKDRIKLALGVDNLSKKTFYVSAFYLSRYYQVEVLPNVKSVSRTYKELDNTHFKIPVDKFPHLNQTIENYIGIFSLDRIPLLNFNYPKKIQEILFPAQENIRDKDIDEEGIERESQLNLDHTWFTKQMRIKLLRELGAIGEEEVSIADGRIFIEAHPKFKAKVSICSSARYLQGPLVDTLMDEWFSSLDMRPIEIIPESSRETILEIHHIEQADSLAMQPLEVLFKGIEKKVKEVWAITLPEDISEDIPEAKSKTDKPQYSFPILSRALSNHSGIFKFFIGNLPPNPNDGRFEKGNSCKISFIPVLAEQLEMLENMISHSQNSLPKFEWKP